MQSNAVNAYAQQVPETMREVPNAVASLEAARGNLRVAVTDLRARLDSIMSPGVEGKSGSAPVAVDNCQIGANLNGIARDLSMLLEEIQDITRRVQV